jgi:hypothetical protein
MMVSGGGSSSSGAGSTGQTTSLSFVPALLGNAFFGSGIGINDGGFSITGLGDFNTGGKIKGSKTSSLVDPFGLSQIIGSNPLLGPRNPFSQRNPFNQINQGEPGGDLISNFMQRIGGGSGLDTANTEGGNPQPMGPMRGTFDTLSGLFGGGLDTPSPEDLARNRIGELQRFSPGALGLGSGGILSPFDLISNLTDLADPGINPGVAGGLEGLLSGQLGGQLANQLLFGDVAPTLQEGLQTGFKPDLQPIINEASRSFFQDIVPQLGQSNVALQEGVGPFSTDLNRALTGAGATLASQLGALEVENQNRAADRRGEFLGLSNLITDQLFNAGTDAGRNLLNLGEQLALQGTRGGRQSQLLAMLAGIQPGGPIQSSQSENRSKSGQGGISI